jgi:superoxide dismutase, Cu-Zn family
MTITSNELKQLAAFGIAGILIGCGGSPSPGERHAERRQPSPTSAAVAESRAGPETPRSDERAGSEPLHREEADEAEWQTLEPTIPPASPSADPADLRAAVELEAVKGGASLGHATFHQLGDDVVIRGEFADLPPGIRGIRVNEHADCSARGASRTATHFNPTGARHGPPESPQRHAGDFGNVFVGDDGRATFDMTTDSLTLTEGPDSVVGRTLVITARRDDGKSATSAGPAIACGVIELHRESTAAAAPIR